MANKIVVVVVVLLNACRPTDQPANQSIKKYIFFYFRRVDPLAYNYHKI